MIHGEITYISKAGKTVKVEIRGINEKDVRKNIAKRVDKYVKSGKTEIQSKVVFSAFETFAGNIKTGNMITRKVRV